jgi:hypothetical protein
VHILLAILLAQSTYPGRSCRPRVRRVAAGGVVRPSYKLGDAASGLPRMTKQGNDVYVTWTESGTAKRVRVAKLRLH